MQARRYVPTECFSRSTLVATVTAKCEVILALPRLAVEKKNVHAAPNLDALPFSYFICTSLGKFLMSHSFLSS